MKIIEQPPPSGASVQVEVLQRAPSHASEAHSAAARKLARSAALVLKEEPSFELVRVFWRQSFMRSGTSSIRLCTGIALCCSRPP